MSIYRKRLMTLLLLLVYAGQSAAALLAPCMHDEDSEVMTTMHHGVMPAPSAAVHDHSMMGMGHAMDHAGMVMDEGTTAHSNPSSTDVRDDCCGALGHCLMSGCSAHVANLAALALPDAVKNSSVHHYSVHRSESPASLRFRPPIFS
jgi:hypothetical protein